MSSNGAAGADRRPVDSQATAETAALYRSLAALEGRATLFGHQDDLAYGHDWSAVDGRSDVKAVVGAYPSVLGFDLGRLETGSSSNIDGVDFGNMRRWIRQGYEYGSVITLSWHSVNPVTGGGYGNNTAPNTIRSVLPGGPRHSTLLDWLDRFAAFDRSLLDADGRPIPIVFRPYHEHSGDWFWWGIGNGLNSNADFIQLWRFTYDYLTRTKGLHNLLWAVSPDRSRLNVGNLANEYLAMYPGDPYVDVLGIDNYQDTQNNQFATYVQVLEAVSNLAQQRGKLAAQTETGNTSGSQPWTGFLLRAQKASAATRRILWSLVWRNPTGGSGGAPYPGSPTAADFVAFYNDAFTMFADTLPDLYAPGGGTTSTTTTSTTPTTTSTTPTTTSTTPTTTSATTSTTTSATATTTRTTTSSASAEGCTATYVVQSQWPGGFVGTVTVAAGSAAVTGWRVGVTLPAGTSLVNIWNGVASGASGTIIVANQSYNGQLGAGQVTTFGFQAGGSDTGVTVTCRLA